MGQPAIEVESEEKQGGPLLCGCCRQMVRGVAKARLTQEEPLTWQCACRDKARCFMCGRCDVDCKCKVPFFERS
jgi:hypothetical protein